MESGSSSQLCNHGIQNHLIQLEEQNTLLSFNFSRFADMLPTFWLKICTDVAQILFPVSAEMPFQKQNKFVQTEPLTMLLPNNVMPFLFWQLIFILDLCELICQDILHDKFAGFFHSTLMESFAKETVP